MTKIINIPGSDAGTMTQVDENGNPIIAHQGVDGGYHLGTSIIQDVYADTNNSSVANLNAANSYTFTGTGTSTLGVVGLQWNLKTDQNATVYIEQSDDNTNWDISDAFDYRVGYSSGGNTVQAVTSYWRIRVVLVNGSDTTYFRLAGVLCPIADPLPRSLSHDERLKASSIITDSQHENRHAWINPTSEINTSPVYRLVGTAFDGSTKDTNFWTEAVANGGTATQASAEIQLETNTTADGYAQYQSVRKARFVAGSAQYFGGGVNWKTAATANNIRRVGAYTTDGSDDIEDGFFFQLDGATFGIGYANGGSVTTITTGNFNGKHGVTWTPAADTYYLIGIEFTPLGAFWYINGVLLHRLNQAGFVATNTVNVTIENENTSGITTDIKFNSVGLYIARQGEIVTNPTYRYISTNTTTICKRGAGTLHRLIANDNRGVVKIYDNTAGSGALISELDTSQGSEPAYTIEYGCPFNDGLTIVTSGGIEVTVIYE